jgi:hypothetical protein
MQSGPVSILDKVLDSGEKVRPEAEIEQLCVCLWWQTPRGVE